MGQQSERQRARGPASFLVAAVVNVIILFIANAHETWRPWLRGIVTPAFAEALWAINLNGFVQVVGNLVLVVTRPVPLQRLMEVGFSIFGLIGAVVMYQVFPFDVARFGDWAPVVLRILLILGIVGTAIGLVVNLFRLVGSVVPGHRPVHP